MLILFTECISWWKLTPECQNMTSIEIEVAEIAFVTKENKIFIHTPLGDLTAYQLSIKFSIKTYNIGAIFAVDWFSQMSSVIIWFFVHLKGKYKAAVVLMVTLIYFTGFQSVD